MERYGHWQTRRLDSVRIYPWKDTILTYKTKTDEKDEEEEELFEIDIDDVTYCTNNEENGFIYQLSEDGDVGTKVGYFKDGEPFFYADEN
jgi:hypothetical protein